MTKLQGFVVFLLFAATAIAAPAQTFTSLASFDGSDDGSLPWRLSAYALAASAAGVSLLTLTQPS
jgi:hypothetical protein